MRSTILHIAQDEKFINAAYKLFEEAFLGANRFIIIKPQGNPSTRFINKETESKCEIEIISDNTINKLLDLSNKSDVTVFHGLDKLKGTVFLKSSNKNRFMSIVYGAEIYNKEVIGGELLGTETTKLNDSLKNKTVYETFKELFRTYRYKDCVGHESTEMREVLYKMNVYGSLPSISYKKYIEKGIYNPSVKKIPFSYYPLELIVKNENLRASGCDILLGNSASATNNHIEALNKLKDHNLNGQKIFTPLSYGQKRYAKAVISYGNKLFQDNFEPLSTFLPLEDYNKIISRCGIVIMNHYRPQAMGNIIASLFMGAKVFLNDTDAYRYFKDLGCYVYLIGNDMRNEKNTFELLSSKKVEHNRQTLKAELSMPVLVKKMRTSFKRIFEFG